MRHRHLVVLALASPAAAQSCAWLNVAPSPSPWGDIPAIACDTQRAVMVQVINANPDGPGSYTYEWNGSGEWQSILAFGPLGAIGHAMAYDQSRGRTVCFGGLSFSEVTGVEYYNDTNEWDGHLWYHTQTATGPSKRIGAAMAYDSARARVMLYGGTSEHNETLGDLWEWDGTSWTDRTSSSGPTAVGNAVLAYDSDRATLILIKNYETWEWPSATQTWSLRLSGSGPTLVWGAAYHAARRRTVVTAQSGTWEWDGQTWTSGTGMGLSYGAPSNAAYNAAHQQVVSIGLLAIYPFVCGTLVYTHTGANCDQSTAPPILNINDFQCFLNKFAAGDPYANCDGSTTPPTLNAADFQCFLNTFATGCP
jgi:hypothetical protein